VNGPREEDAGWLLTDEEAAMGFAVQTLSYPDDYELPLRSPGAPAHLVRCVALVLDAENRLRRERGGSGYVLEHFDGRRWRAVEHFGSAEEVRASDPYRAYRRAAQEAEAASCEEPPAPD